MPTLPRIPPTHINDRKEPSYGAERFVSSAGIASTTRDMSTPQGYGFSLRYAGLFPAEYGKFMDFFTEVGYDEALKSSLTSRALNIPVGHPVWRLMPEIDFMERKLTTKDVNTALWLIQSVAVSVPVTRVYDLRFAVKNVWA